MSTPPPLPQGPSEQQPVSDAAPEGAAPVATAPVATAPRISAPGPGAEESGPPPIPYEMMSEPPSKLFGVCSGVAALLVVAATLAVVGRAVMKAGSLPAAAGAAAKVERGGGITPLAPDPLDPAGVGASAKADEMFDRATDALRASQEGTAEPARKWADSGGMDLSGVKNAQELDRRIELLDALARATREARLAGEGVMQQLRGELSAVHGASAVQQELWVAQWAARVRLDDDRQAALAREKFLGAGREQLRMLRQEWGRWYLDRSAGKVQFDDAALQERHARLAAHAAAKERELNETLARLGGAVAK